MTRRERLELERLRRLLEEEHTRAERAWVGYRDMLQRAVTAEAKLQAVREVLGEGGEEGCLQVRRGAEETRVRDVEGSG